MMLVRNRFRHPFATAVGGSFALCALLEITPAMAAPDEGTEQNHLVILELGASGEREISEGTSHIGPAVGLEIEPIENWLEIELGASTYTSQGARNWEIELPFKKPFRLSGTIEVMPGLGPTWTHTTQSAAHSSTWGAVAVIDLFVWRTRRLGWFLEPSFGVASGNGNQKSVGLTGGIFFAVP
jgi:hypothetical protein